MYTRVILLMATLITFSVSICGAVMTRGTTEQLTEGASTIVIADVVSVEPEWACGGTTIFTYVRLHVTDWLKGSGFPEITVRVEGGEVDGIGLWVEDEPVFREGEEVVAFLKPSKESGVMEVKGFYQGKFSVENGKVIETGLPLNDFAQKIKRIAAKLDVEEK